MNPYKTIKDCAVDIICREGDKLSNKEIADKVRQIMESNTSERCIAWYKNKINRGIIKINKNRCNWLKKGNKIYTKRKQAVTIRFSEWFSRNRESTSWEIINAKILLSLISILLVRILISPFLNFIEGGNVKKNVLWGTIIGWFLTSIRSWWSNRRVKRLSESNDIDTDIRDKCKQVVKWWGHRNFGDLIPIYIINYPFLIISIYFIVTEISPWAFNKELTTTQMCIFALILGFTIDRIWELFKNFPESLVKLIKALKP